MPTVSARLMHSAFANIQRTGGRRLFATGENLVKTSLNELHKELGGDMVPFAGYELPVLYKRENGGVMKEHLWCRDDGKAALFDGEFESEDVKCSSCLIVCAQLATWVKSAGMARIGPIFWRKSWLVISRD